MLEETGAEQSGQAPADRAARASPGGLFDKQPPPYHPTTQSPHHPLDWTIPFLVLVSLIEKTPANGRLGYLDQPSW